MSGIFETLVLALFIGVPAFVIYAVVRWARNRGRQTAQLIALQREANETLRQIADTKNTS